MEQGEEGARENNLKSAREGGGDGEKVEKSKAARKGTYRRHQAPRGAG